MAAEAEIELKFLFRERDSAKIKALVSAAAGARPPDHQRLHAVYFDTPNSDLWKHGFTLRVRTAGKSHIQTVKQMRSSSIHPGEWEAETATLEPALDLLKNTPLARQAAKPSIRGALRPSFEVKVERTSYIVEVSGGVIEASLDQGVIEANGDTVAVRELEFELKTGSQRTLYNLGHAFVLQAPLHLSLISKAERGHLLGAGALGHTVKSSRPHLEKDMTCGQAFQHICQTCLRDFHLNMSGLEKPDNSEAIHQGRIAIRRLRAAMMLFKPLVFDIAYRKMLGELRWLARSLGAARDLDVLKEKLLPRTAWDQADAPTRELAYRCEAEGQRARQSAVDALNSERGRLLLLDLVVWIEDGRWQRQPSGIAGESIQGFAGRRLKKRHKRLIRKGAGLANLAPGPRHKVRIEAKELRYMAEFFIDVPGVAKDRRRLRKIIDYCEKLQAALGLIRDEEALAEFMEREGWGGAKAATDGAETAILLSSVPPQKAISTKRELKKAVRAFSQLAVIEAF